MPISYSGIVDPWGQTSENVRSVFDTLVKTKQEEIKAERATMQKAFELKIKEEQEIEKEQRQEERDRAKRKEAEEADIRKEGRREKREISKEERREKTTIAKEEREKKTKAVDAIAKSNQEEWKQKRIEGDKHLTNFLGLLNKDPEAALVYGNQFSLEINRSAPGFDPSSYTKEKIAATNATMTLFQSLSPKFTRDEEGNAIVEPGSINMNSYENQQKLLKIIVTSKKAGPAVKDISNWAERAYKDILFPSQQKGSVRQKKPLERVMDKINNSEALTMGDYRIAKEYARKEAIKSLKDSNEYKEADAPEREAILKHEMSNILNNMGAFVNPPASASKERKEDQKTLPAGGYVYDPAGGLRKK